MSINTADAKLFTGFHLNFVSEKKNYTKSLKRTEKLKESVPMFKTFLNTFNRDKEKTSPSQPDLPAVKDPPRNAISISPSVSSVEW